MPSVGAITFDVAPRRIHMHIDIPARSEAMTDDLEQHDDYTDDAIPDETDKGEPTQVDPEPGEPAEADR